MKVFHLPKRAIADWFGDVRVFLEAACKVHGFLDVDDVHWLLTQGRAALSIAVADSGQVIGCFVTEIVEFPKRTAINIVLVGGIQGFLAHGFGQVLKELEQKAIEVKADAIAGLGRPGFERVARRFGWRSRAMTSLWKELGDGRESQGRQQHHADDAVGAVDRRTASTA